MDAPHVRDVSDWLVADIEAMGSESNVWLRDPDGETWLFKPNRVRQDGQEQGEDWAEVLAASVARLLGVPTAFAEVVVRGSVRGALSRNILSSWQRVEGWELQAGRVLLGLADLPGLKPRERHPGHTVEAVMRALMEVAPPAGAPGMTAQQAFAGYLVLDALIANQDRHERNWAVLVRPSGDLELAPSYDHGAALGSALRDDRRARMLQEGRVVTYADRGAGKQIENGQTTLVAVALMALRVSGGDAAGRWLDRLGEVADADLVAAVAATPRMSDPARTFCSSLLIENRRRLLDARP